jgi:hypothetical protein
VVPAGRDGRDPAQSAHRHRHIAAVGGGGGAATPWSHARGKEANLRAALDGRRWKGSERAVLYALRNQDDGWIWDYVGPAPDSDSVACQRDVSERRRTG